MQKSNLSALGKKELIEKYHRLEKKNQRLQSKLIEASLEHENEKRQLSDTIKKLTNSLNELNNEYNKWSVNNVIPTHKTEYTREEIRQILAWDEGCDLRCIRTPEKHKEYFEIQDEWYEVKTFFELLRTPELKELKYLNNSSQYNNLKTKEEYLNTFRSDTKTNQRKIMNHILNSDKVDDYYVSRKHFEKKEYYEAFKTYIERELEKNDFRQLGKYNLYKIWIHKEYADATAQIFAADKAEADFYTSQDGYDSSKLYEGD